MSNRSIHSDVVDEILVAVAAGFSHRQVAELVGVAIGTVSRYVHAEKVKLQLPVYVGPSLRAGSFTLGDRVKISVGVERGESNAVIGERLGFHRSSVWREVSRNGGVDHYDPGAAHGRACHAGMRAREFWFETKPWLWDRVVDLLRTKKWSPQQISARLRRDHDDHPDWSVSYESIYQAVFVQAKPELRKELSACLRSGRAKRVPHGHRGPRGAGTGSIPNMINISERPAEVENRAVPGHWEGDLILGKRGSSYVATLVERNTRFGLLVKLDNKTAAHVAQRIAEAIKRLPAALARSLTWDQGTELADHHKISTTAEIDVYFCDPHAPWQRGSNENWNGLVRQFLPKGTDLSVHTQQELDEIANLLNTRPRNTLGWDTPAEQFNQLVAATP